MRTSVFIHLFTTLVWLCQTIQQLHAAAVPTGTSQQEPDGDQEVDEEDGPRSMRIVFHSFLPTSTETSAYSSSPSRLPTTTAALYDEIKKIMTSYGTEPGSCFHRSEVPKIGELIANLPPARAMRSFGIYQTCKQCVHVCGGRGLYLEPNAEKFCLIDVQGCSTHAATCQDEKTSTSVAKGVRKETAFLCRYSKGCWCKFKRLPLPPVEKKSVISSTVNPSDNTTPQQEEEDANDVETDSTVVFEEPLGKRNNSFNHHRGHKNSPREPWVYENRVTIALLSVWLFCAIVYVGYNYKCVGDACFGWIPCYQRLVGLEVGPEGVRRRRRRGRGRRHRQRRAGDGEHPSPASSEDSSPATPPRAHRARQINMETALTTTSLPKYEDVVTSTPTILSTGNGCGAFEMGRITSIHNDDSSLPTYEQATAMSVMETPSVSHRHSSCPATPAGTIG